MVGDDAVEIRPAVPSDATAIARVHISSWRSAYTGIVPDDYLASLDLTARVRRWTRILAEADSSTWVALANQRAIGFASIGPSRDEDAHEGGVELYAIYLDPESWGRGVARDLIRTLLQHVPEQAPISLWVIADNARAQHFYRRHGFAADGVERLEEFGGKQLTLVRYVRVAK